MQRDYAQMMSAKGTTATVRGKQALDQLPISEQQGRTEQTHRRWR
jgi:hypothetical protein